MKIQQLSSIDFKIEVVTAVDGRDSKGFNHFKFTMSLFCIQMLVIDFQMVMIISTQCANELASLPETI